MDYMEVMGGYDFIGQDGVPFLASAAVRVMYSVTCERISNINSYVKRRDVDVDMAACREMYTQVISGIVDLTAEFKQVRADNGIPVTPSECSMLHAFDARAAAAAKLLSEEITQGITPKAFVTEAFVIWNSLERYFLACT